MNRRNFLQIMFLATASFFSRVSTLMGLERSILSPVAVKQARTIGKNLVQSEELSFKALDSFVARTSSGNIMHVLFEIFREAIRQTNEDKRYFLEKLKTMNDLAESMGDYLKTLNAMSRDLADRIPGQTGGGQEGSGKGQPCDPPTAVRNTYHLERMLNSIEYQIQRLPMKERAKPDIQGLMQSLQRDRKLISKARSVYLGIKH